MARRRKYRSRSRKFRGGAGRVKRGTYKPVIGDRW